MAVLEGQIAFVTITVAVRSRADALVCAKLILATVAASRKVHNPILQAEMNITFSINHRLGKMIVAKAIMPSSVRTFCQRRLRWPTEHNGS